MPVLGSILEAIRRTPLVRLERVASGLAADVHGKVEMMNPGGSVKDRIGLAMVDAARRTGQLKPGDTIVEATAGNTGVALAIAAAVFGYRCVFVMPEKMSRDKEDILRAYGAEVVRAANVPPGDPAHFQETAKRLARENGWFLPDQFANPANPEIHYRTMGPEIWADTEGRVDALVCGVGTGGTLTGAGRYLKERKPGLRIVLADPVGSAAGRRRGGALPVGGNWRIGSPANLDTSSSMPRSRYPTVKRFLWRAGWLARRVCWSGALPGARSSPRWLMAPVRRSGADHRGDPARHRT